MENEQAVSNSSYSKSPYPFQCLSTAAKIGSFVTFYAGRSRSGWTLETNGRVLTRFELSPSRGTRAVACEMDDSPSSGVAYFTRGTHAPIPRAKLQSLKKDSYPCSADFVHWMFEMKIKDQCFPGLLLFSDEAKKELSRFTIKMFWLTAILTALPLVTTSRNFQRMSKHSTFFGHYLVYPYISLDHLTSATYHIFLEQVLPSLLHVLSLSIQRGMWFMHDGVPPYFFPSWSVICWMPHIPYNGSDVADL